MVVIYSASNNLGLCPVLYAKNFFFKGARRVCHSISHDARLGYAVDACSTHCASIFEKPGCSTIGCHVASYSHSNFKTNTHCLWLWRVLRARKVLSKRTYAPRFPAKVHPSKKINCCNLLLSIIHCNHLAAFSTVNHPYVSGIWTNAIVDLFSSRSSNL